MAVESSSHPALGIEHQVLNIKLNVKENIKLYQTERSLGTLHNDNFIYYVLCFINPIWAYLKELSLVNIKLCWFAGLIEGNNTTLKTQTMNCNGSYFTSQFKSLQSVCSQNTQL